MTLFDFPKNLKQVAYFSLPRVQTWGSANDRAYKESVRQAAGIAPDIRDHYNWFAFVIRCVVAKSRGRIKNQIPDVENIPKLIVDAFTGVLYPDDHIRYVRGVSVEAILGKDEHEMAEVWIFGKPKD